MSDIEEMMNREGFTDLEFDRSYNSLTIRDRSGEAEESVTISFDLIHAFEKMAEKSGEEVFTVTTKE